MACQTRGGAREGTVGHMDVYEAIHSRRDVEAFAEDAPTREQLERIIEAATWAPNHRLTEPWRFVVVAAEGRTRMADAIAAWLAATGGTEGAERSARSKLMRAPVTVFLAQTGSPDDLVRDREDYAACACALQNLLLAAEAEGLAAHTSTAELIEYPGTKEYLGLGEHDRVVAMVSLGRLRDDAPSKVGVRKPPAVRWDW